MSYCLALLSCLVLILPMDKFDATFQSNSNQTSMFPLKCHPFSEKRAEQGQGLGSFVTSITFVFSIHNLSLGSLSRSLPEFPGAHQDIDSFPLFISVGWWTE